MADAASLSAVPVTANFTWVAFMLLPVLRSKMSPTALICTMSLASVPAIVIKPKPILSIALMNTVSAVAPAPAEMLTRPVRRPVEFMSTRSVREEPTLPVAVIVTVPVVVISASALLAEVTLPSILAVKAKPAPRVIALASVKFSPEPLMVNALSDVTAPA